MTKKNAKENAQRGKEEEDIQVEQLEEEWRE